MGINSLAYNDSSGLYRIWKMEQQIWLEGHVAMEKYALPDALIISPYPMPTRRMKDLIAASSSASAFDELEMVERHFLNLDKTIVITYEASAKHKRFKNRYEASCMTTYVRIDGVYKIAGHTHTKLPRGTVKRKELRPDPAT